jgi:hypothetical protein
VFLVPECRAVLPCILLPESLTFVRYPVDCSQMICNVSEGRLTPSRRALNVCLHILEFLDAIEIACYVSHTCSTVSFPTCVVQGPDSRCQYHGFSVNSWSISITCARLALESEIVCKPEASYGVPHCRASFPVVQSADGQFLRLPTVHLR